MPGLTQPVRKNAYERPEDIATVFPGRTRSWGELLSRAARLAGYFRSSGLATGDRVAVYALNSDRYLEIYYAIWWAGCVVVPINTRWSQAESIHALQDAAPKLLMFDESCLPGFESLRKAATSITNAVYIGDAPAPPGVHDYEQQIDDHEAIEDALRSGDDLAGIFYTGGTSGVSKGVMLSHAGMYISALGGIAFGNYAMKNYVYLHQAPMFHLGDVAMLTCGSMLGATHAFLPAFSPIEAAAAIERYRVTHTMFVPAMLDMFLASPDVEQHDLASLKRISYGASPMPASLIRKAQERFPGVELLQGYGQTELSPLATVLLPEDHELADESSTRLRSAGRPAPHCEVEVVDGGLRPLGRSEIGQVRVRGGNVMLGYWGLPKLTEETLIDGWVLTGDAGYFDEDGYLYLVDRLKDMIITGGENVYSAEVENVIMEHPAIAQCAVIGLPHPKWVESVHAVVVLKPDFAVSEDELMLHCRNFISGYKCPRSIEFRQQPLPMSGAGKVLKRELRAECVESLGSAGQEA